MWNTVTNINSTNNLYNKLVNGQSLGPLLNVSNFEKDTCMCICVHKNKQKFEV